MLRTTVQCLVLGAALFAGCWAVDLAAGGGLHQTVQQPVFSADANLVRVDVSVLDKQGAPVRGLTAKDFTVAEDGHAQAVQTFLAIDVPVADPHVAAWTRTVAPDVQDNQEPGERRIVVVVMDDAMVPFEQQMVASAKAIAKSAIDQLGPQDLAAVVFTRDNRHAQEFTHDRARLLSAVQTFSSGGHDPSVVGAEEAQRESPLYFASINALRRVAETLEALPDRRKALIWVSVGVPFNIEELSNPASPFHLLLEQWKDAIDAARRANVNVYGVDPSGLNGMYLDVMQHKDWSRFPSNFSREDFATDRARLHQSLLIAMSENTGGRAFINSNEFTSKVTQIFTETGSFYLLGYVPTDTKADGKLRKIQVKVTRPGVTVHARMNYYAPEPPGTKVAPDPISPATAAIAGLVPRSDLPITLTAASFGVVGAREQPVAISLGIAPPTAGATDEVTAMIEVFTFDGVLKQTVRVATQSRSVRQGGVEQQLLAQVALLPGRYQVRAAVTNGTAGKTGSVYADLDVPDVTKDPLTLSGVVLSTTPEAAATPADALAALLPVVPVTARTFTPIDYVGAFLRLYQGGTQPLAPVTVTTRIVSDQDVVAFTATETIAPEQFTAMTRAVDHQLALPLAKLAPGEYLLTFEATLGKTTVRRDARFRVR
jgi:VWFA-related protein